MDQTLPWGESPIDLPDETPDDPDAGPGGIAWASGAVLTSSLALLLFNSHALANWADQLPVAPVTAPIVMGADDWHARAGRLGLNTVVDGVARAAAAMREAQWPQTAGSRKAKAPGAQR